MAVWPTRNPARLDSLMLALLAGVTLILARAEPAWNPLWMATRASSELLLAVVVALLLRRRADTLQHSQRLAGIAVAIVALYPFLADLLWGKLVGNSEPLELMMVTSLQLTAVVLAVFSHVPRMAGTSVLLSSFLLLFVTTMTNSRVTLLLIGVCGAVVLWWLMGAYWDRLAQSHVACRIERRIPVRVSVLVGTVLFLVLLGTGIISTGASAVALRGFMPTSGGTQWNDPDARSGIGDGDDMVAAQDEAMSFGPVESELFLESEMPALYDVVDEMLGQPIKRNRLFERAIGLETDQFKDTDQRVAKTEKSSREFSTLRRKAERKSELLNDRKAPAMLYVVGRVPLHLALERFDSFDGQIWTHSSLPPEMHPIRLETRNDKPWAVFRSLNSSPIHRGIEPHAIKFINLKTNRFPSPPHLSAVHIDQVEQEDFFGWTEDGVASMPVRSFIPQLTVVHMRSERVNLQLLREMARSVPVAKAGEERHSQELEPVEAPTNPNLQHLDAPGRPATASAIAAAWTRGTPRGWRQVEKVVERLRLHFELDPQAVAPADCSDVVSHFLQARRGPAYLFATTAAVLLRELGYPTRLVTGFYANKSRFDRRAGQTVVLAEDVHVWVEVDIGGHTWVTIEPTPGFEPPPEHLTWHERLAWMWYASCRWCWQHLAQLALGLAVIIAGWLTRIYWLDSLLTMACKVAGRIDSPRRVLWTMRLLEWRGWLAGHPRPAKMTLSRWLEILAGRLPASTAACLHSTLRAAEVLLYGPQTAVVAAAAATELPAACALVERRVGASSFRQVLCQVKKSNGKPQ